MASPGDDGRRLDGHLSGRAVLGLTPVQSGAIYFQGSDITHAGFAERRRLSTMLQVVFQDPYGSLNPTRTIWQILAEPLQVHRPDLDRAAREAMARTMISGFIPRLKRWQKR